LSEPATSLTTPPARQWLLYFLLGLLALGCLAVLRPFLSAICWAVVLAYVSWPLHRRIRGAFRGWQTSAALASTLLVVAVVMVPILWLAVLVQAELVDAYRNLAAFFAAGPHVLPALIRNLPWIGARMQEAVDQLAADPDLLGRSLREWLQRHVLNSPGVVADLGRNIGKAVAIVFTLFFCYRDGESVVHQVRGVSARNFDHRLDGYVFAAGVMTRTVLYGFLLTSGAQGLIAGLGFWIVGIQAPILLGALTGLLSAIPVIGTAAVWVPIAAWLLLTGQVWQGALLLAWGALLVHPTDNILRPLLISHVAHVPFLLVMFGALGGLSSFGLVGLVVGPVLLTIGLAIWREWAGAGPGGLPLK
jgi:predicted PurR-regulated permease PerM